MAGQWKRGKFTQYGGGQEPGKHILLPLFITSPLNTADGEAPSLSDLLSSENFLIGGLELTPQPPLSSGQADLSILSLTSYVP